MIRSSSSSKSDLHYHAMPARRKVFGGGGQRICKIVKPRNGSGVLNQAEWTYTYYVRDAQGNTIAVYDRDYVHPDTKFYDVLTQKENHLYGSSRVGVKNDTTRLASQQYSFVAYNTDSTFDLSTPNTLTSTGTDANSFVHEMGRKSYELVNHLGNVLVTVSDMRTANNSGVTVTGWNAVVNSATDYYAFGAPMPGRVYSSNSYRYAYDGQEKDPELMEGALSFEYRVEDPRLGRFLSIDPLAADYPWNSPYAFAENRPIDGRDLEGCEWDQSTDDNGNTTVTVNVEATVDPTMTSEETDQVFTAIDNQFNSTLQTSSGGKFSGHVTFNKATETNQVVPHLDIYGVKPDPNLGPDDVMIGGMTSLNRSGINFYNKDGSTKTPEDLGYDAVHELFHTLRIEHPFEITQGPDTELKSAGSNNYSTTPNTDPNIIYNIMMYPMIRVNGVSWYDLNTTQPQSLLTNDQLTLMINEINLQKAGYGATPKYNQNLSSKENRDVYMQYFYDYWMNPAGTPVQ